MNSSDQKEDNSEVEEKKIADELKEENEEEEEGEINDGEKLKKAFVPKILCKFYQRGKCTWGRACKFLHPGVNDTGSYNFLEFQDPNAKVYQQQQQIISMDPKKSQSIDVDNTTNEASKELQTESAWERGLRHAKEMKEKALKRKQIEKEEFDDKKMNLSLKEFEDEKENDERHLNIEK
jgi:nuclear protein NHN1